MPNHVTNIVTIEGVSEDRLTAILAAIRMDDVEGRRSLDFNKIIPMPDSVYQGNLGNKERQIYGENNWYDWAVKNWGTKWNSYDYDNEPIHGDFNQIEFQTAWSRPEPVVVRLSEMYPDVQFRHQWADEDIGVNVGEITYQEGEEIEYDVPEGGSKEAYEMAADIMGVELSDYDLFYSEDKGTYVYCENDFDEDEAEDESQGMGGLT
jgi:hypothetical protein